MKNFKSSGNKVDVLLVEVATSGAPLKVGATMLGIPGASGKIGETISMDVLGEFEVPKKSADVMVAGNKVAWNNGNKEFQNATGTDIDDAATITVPAAGGLTLVTVRLTPR